MSGRVRALLTVLLALSMLVTLSVSALAQDTPAEPTAVPVEEVAAPAEPTAVPAEEVAAPAAVAAPVESVVARAPVQPYGKICVEGSVINFDETLLPTTEPGEEYSELIAWAITAKQSGTAIQRYTDEDGYFEFEAIDEETGNPNFQPGVVEFEIAIPPDSGWEPITDNLFTVELKYSDKCTVIRFKLKRPVPVEVLKIDDNHNPLEDWSIKAEPVYGNWFASTIITETWENGIAYFRLTEGEWTFTEQAPNGTSYTAVVPSSGEQELDVDWNDYADNNFKPIQIRFKNRLATHGCMDVYKMDMPPTGDPYGLPGWKMTVKRMDGSTVSTLYTDATGMASFKNLPFGTYIVEEEARSGWTADPSKGGTKRYVTVSDDQGEDADQCVEVDFYNYQSFGYCIEGRKVDTNGLVGLPDWEITAEPVATGGYPDPAVDQEVPDAIEDGQLITWTDGLGSYRFDFPKNDYRIPGAAYTICEEERDGWLPHTSLCQTVYLPKTPGACVKAWDFENQQVGHWESVVYGPSTSSSSSSSSCSYTHTVQPGESLYGIGADYGVSASAMLAANPWVYSRPHYYVYPGDTVCIP
jgi:hypothetical protein